MTKRVFTRKLAVYLREQGFKIVRTEVNYKKPQFDIYVFEDTPDLELAIIRYSENGK